MTDPMEQPPRNVAQEALRQVEETVGAQEPTFPQTQPRGATPERFDDEAEVAEILNQAARMEGVANDNPLPLSDNPEEEWVLDDTPNTGGTPPFAPKMDSNLSVDDILKDK